MVRIWFNHWFSTSYQIINLLKKENKDFVVIGSNRQYYSVIQNACDEWYEEPELNGEEYLEFCIGFCKKNKINAFVPKHNMVDISKNIDRFHEIGVKVMVDKYELISILSNKDKTYDLFKNSKNIQVPDFKVVRSLVEFEEAYRELNKKYERVCVKFVQDEGGQSFRIIENTISKFAALSLYPSSKISYLSFVDALSDEVEFKDMIVMPYLPGNEISVDCLKTANGLIAIPRMKGPSRDEQIQFHDDIIGMCNEILEKVPLEYPCNIQFKILDNIPYLLEINTRMSGGIQMSCLATEVNIPDIAINKLLGVNKKWSANKSTKRVSYIEMAQLIELD
ncbi:MAG: ATP-grasp domain-containing protein [Lachnotalea sp.]